MEAVVYTSNTGSTEHYAKLLGHELRVSVYSTEEAGNKLPTGTEIIYLGWIMAGKIQRFGLARKKYKICAVCAVGMGQTGTVWHGDKIIGQDIALNDIVIGREGPLRVVRFNL